jgi:hypothetical protein
MFIRRLAVAVTNDALPWTRTDYVQVVAIYHMGDRVVAGSASQLRHTEGESSRPSPACCAIGGDLRLDRRSRIGGAYPYAIGAYLHGSNPAA